MKTGSAVTPSPDYGTAFPGSLKIYEEKSVDTPAGAVQIRVPAREVTLSGGEPPVRLYDTSGPAGPRRSPGTAEVARVVGRVRVAAAHA